MKLIQRMWIKASSTLDLLNSDNITFLVIFQIGDFLGISSILFLVLSKRKVNQLIYY